MEISAIQSLSYATNVPKTKPFSHSSASLLAYNHVPSLGFKCLPRKLRQCRTQIKSGERQNFGGGVVHASSGAESSATNDAERWLLEPVGDGDSRHIGFKVAMPSSYEIESSVVNVGRVPEKVDMVIPVATVSGLHARIQQKEGQLFVTDLDSTNGTFINEKRLNPGVAFPAPPGSFITFGDTNLAIFRVSKLEKAKVPAETAESETESGTEASSNALENAS